MKPRIVATIPPVAAIVRELAGDRAEVTSLLRPGVSEHHFEARPSDMRAAEGAIALVSCAPDIDGWSDRIPSLNRICLINHVPAEGLLPSFCDHVDGDHDGHESEAVDGHFWTDPSLVRVAIGPLARELAAFDPEGADVYLGNARRFEVVLDELDAETSAVLASLRGQPVFTYHASLRYMLKRYGLEFRGVVEIVPGQEPSAGQVAALIARMREAGAEVIFTEPHLSPRAAQVIASSTGFDVYELDPVGGVPGRMTYRELIAFNASTLGMALGARRGAERAEAE